MEELYKLFLGIVIVFLGFPLGTLLKSLTKDEIRKGQRKFKIIILICFIGAIISIILEKDSFFFTFLFISAVTSGSILPRFKKLKK